MLALPAAGKPIGNGFPMSAVVASRQVAEHFANGMEFFATYGGSTAAAVAGEHAQQVQQGQGGPAAAQRRGHHRRRQGKVQAHTRSAGERGMLPEVFWEQLPGWLAKDYLQQMTAQPGSAPWSSQGVELRCCCAEMPRSHWAQLCCAVLCCPASH
jgi:acetylornithine/succinyldiaminopimelate/putrescine aminotransferase